MAPKIYLPWLAIIACCLLLAGIAYTLYPFLHTSPFDQPALRLLHNGRQLQIMVQAAAMDRLEARSEAGWPADVEAETAVDYIRMLIEHRYLWEQDLRMLAAEGFEPAASVQELSSENIAFTFYRVSEEDGPQTLFLTTRNYDYLKPLSPARKPWGNKGFVRFLKSGGGRIVAPGDYQNISIVGKLPAATPVILPP